MRVKYISVILLWIMMGTAAAAQDSFNVQQLTPSVLLPVGKWEFKSFNSNYSQTQFFNEDGKRMNASSGTIYNDNGSIKSTPDIIRNTFFLSVNQVNYGLSSRVNVGLELWMNSSERSSSLDSRLGVLSLRQSANSRSGLSYIGVKIKFVPISSVDKFSIQSVFMIPLSKDLESHEQFPRPFLAWDSYFWINQFFLDVPLNRHWLIFLNMDLVWGLNRNERITKLRGNRFTIPVKVFVNYFVTSRMTILLQTEYNQIWQTFGNEQTRSVQTAYYFQLGPAVKYQLITGKLEGEIGCNYFAAGNNGQGAGNSINFGLRYLL